MGAIFSSFFRIPQTHSLLRVRIPSFSIHDRAGLKEYVKVRRPVQIILILLLLSSVIPERALAQREVSAGTGADTVSVQLYFRQGQSSLDMNYRGNRRSLESFVGRMRLIPKDTVSYDSNGRKRISSIRAINIFAGASPEGSSSFNAELSLRRAESIRRLLERNLPGYSDRFVVHAVGVDWPGSDQLVFFAFNGKEDLSALGATVEMPAGEVSGLNQGSGNEQNCSITGITIPREASSQIDLMVGREGPRPEGAVSVNLRHALSQIKIQAKCSRPSIKVEVAGVKIVGVKDVATLLLPNGNTTAQNPSAGMSADRWTEKAFSADADGFIDMHENLAQGSQTQVLNADCQDITSGGGSFMLIPQGTADGVQGWDGSAGDTDGAYIAVLCRISQRKGAADADGYTQLYPVGAARAGLYAWTAVPFQPDWIPGNTYTYCLEFFGTSGGGGKVPPVYPGEEGPAISDNPGVNPGETVVGGPISLTVSVADWYAGTAGGGEWNNSVTMPNSNN